MSARAPAALLVLAAAFAPPAAFAKDARPSLREQILGDEVLMREDDDPAMQAAYARAAATLDDALAVLAAPAPHQSGFSLKVGIAQGATVEYVWIGDIVASSDGQAFEGRIANALRLVDHVRMGQQHRFGRGEIVDWMWVDRTAGRIVGNFTACALFSHEPPAEARAAIKELGLDCDWLQATP
jgi:uncharacterized protein YegJ (DUF2314 family)